MIARLTVTNYSPDKYKSILEYENYTVLKNYTIAKCKVETEDVAVKHHFVHYICKDETKDVAVKHHFVHYYRIGPQCEYFTVLVTCKYILKEK